MRLTPGGDEGLALAVEPSWGNAYGGADALFRREGTLAQIMPHGQPISTNIRPDRVGVELGYKMPVSARTRMAPFGRWTSTTAAGYRVQAGTSVAILGVQMKQPLVTVDVFAEQNVGGYAPAASTSVGLRGSIRLD